MEKYRRGRVIFDSYMSDECDAIDGCDFVDEFIAVVTKFVDIDNTKIDTEEYKDVEDAILTIFNNTLEAYDLFLVSDIKDLDYIINDISEYYTLRHHGLEYINLCNPLNFSKDLFRRLNERGIKIKKSICDNKVNFFYKIVSILCDYRINTLRIVGAIEK